MQFGILFRPNIVPLFFVCLKAPPPASAGDAREAHQPGAGLASSAPRGQTLSGTVHAPTHPHYMPQCEVTPAGFASSFHVKVKEGVMLFFFAEVKEGVILGSQSFDHNCALSEPTLL